MNGNQWRSWIIAGVIGVVTGSGGALTFGHSLTVYDARDLRLEIEAKIERERLERKALERRVRDLETWQSRQNREIPNL